MSDYKPAGKGIAPRKSNTPSWVGLEPCGIENGMVKFKTRTGYKLVPVDEVAKYRGRMDVKRLRLILKAIKERNQGAK